MTWLRNEKRESERNVKMCSVASQLVRDEVSP